MDGWMETDTFGLLEPLDLLDCKTENILSNTFMFYVYIPFIVFFSAMHIKTNHQLILSLERALVYQYLVQSSMRFVYHPKVIWMDFPTCTTVPVNAWYNGTCIHQIAPLNLSKPIEAPLTFVTTNERL